MTPVPDPSPEQFGPYEVYERLGMGGMAMVHRAKKRGPAGFERSVALKRMLSHLAEDPAFVESFVREAKVASLLVHPNIAQVYDFGRISGVYYIAMELVAGFDVRKLLRFANRANEAIPLPVILSVLGELCDALDYAHSFVDESGQPLHIVHRDVSPSNIIVAHTGHLKVIDFGIAKANSRQLHTESGQVKGKLGYMSPEVALGIPVGPVSDIFSVGVVAWELVTASPLFSARTDFETMRKIREEPIVPPSRYNPSCPPKLDGVILAALDREADTRLASARLFRHALDEIAEEAGIAVKARAVSDWMLKFVQPDDHWARSATDRNRSPSGRVMPLPAEPPTAVLRAQAASSQLNRSEEFMKLATEIWGDDVRTVESLPPPDFHRHVATPAGPSLAPVSGQIGAVTAPGRRKTSTPAPSSVPVPAPVLAPAPVAAARPPARTTSKRPLLALGLLALVASALGGVLLWKQSTATPDPVALRFEIEPASAIVSLAGNELGRSSPLETSLAAGSYALRVELDGYKPYASTLTVREGEAQTIRVALEKEEPAEVAIDMPPELVQEDPPAREDEEGEEGEDGADAPPRVTKATRKEKARVAAKDKTVRAEKIEKVAEPSIDPPKLDPPKLDPPKLDPPKTDPPKTEPPKETRPARTPVVAAAAVTKLSGEVPTLRARNADSGDVLAKMCIDERGVVSSVKIVKSNPEIASALKSALETWRYEPYVKDGKATPVCFPLSLRVVVKS